MGLNRAALSKAAQAIYKKLSANGQFFCLCTLRDRYGNLMVAITCRAYYTHITTTKEAHCMIEIIEELPAVLPELPFAPQGLSQLIMKMMLFLPNLFEPGWADEVIGYLAFFSWIVPPPFNWLLIWFVRAV